MILIYVYESRVARVWLTPLPLAQREEEHEDYIDQPGCGSWDVHMRDTYVEEYPIRVDPQTGELSWAMVAARESWNTSTSRSRVLEHKQDYLACA